MTISISKSSGRDLRAILYWLKKEYEDNGSEDGFWCNRRLIRRGHREGKLVVLREDNKAVAFQLEGDILEVRPDKRGKGYGRVLAGLWIESARARDEVYLFIECAPRTSLPFWETMGFTAIDTGLGGIHAYRVLNKRFDLDEYADCVDVEISFYAAQAEDVHPLCTHRPHAVRDGNRIKLAERVIGIQFDEHCDMAVKIQVEGETLYFDEARRADANALGLRQYRNAPYLAYYCDYLIPSASGSAQQAI